MKEKNALITEKPNRILFIQQRQRGDVLISTAAVAKLKGAFPEARIDILTEKMCGEVFQNNPHVSQLLLIDKAEQPNLLKQIAFYRRVAKQGNYDVVVSMQNLPRCLMQVIFSGAKYKLGIRSKRWQYNICYTHLTTSPPVYAGFQRVNVLQPLGISVSGDEKPEWYVADDERIIADEILANFGYDKSKDMLISVDCTQRNEIRRYPAGYYAQLLREIKQAYPNAKFLFMRGPGEEQQVQDCINELEDKSSVIFPEECPSMRISGALVANASYHIGNCSFPRHLAVALNVPSSTFVGPSDPSWAIGTPMHKELKLDIDCRSICNGFSCDKGIACMADMTPELLIGDLLQHIKEFKR